MRSTHYIPCALFVIATCATAACTSLLGSYQVGADQAAPGQEGGPTTEGGSPTNEGGAVDVFVPTDGSTDSPPPPSCNAPKVVCGNSCVDLESNEANCGSCSRSCLGGVCTAHVCQPFALVNRTDVLDTTIAATDTDVFFGTTTNDLIQQPLAAGAAPMKLGTGPGKLSAIALAGTRVYFSVPSGAGWQLWKAAAGVPASGSVANPGQTGTPVGLVAAGSNVHTLVITSTSSESFQIVACPQDGSNCFGNYNGAGRPGAKLAAGNSFVFWTDQIGAGTVYAYPDGVGLRTTISSGEATPSSPAWDGATLFWMNGGNGKLRKSPYPAPTATDFRDITSGANDVLVDAVNVYWSIFNGTDNDLFAAPKAGPASTAPIRLTHGPNIARLAQTAAGIYWADGTAIRGVRKP